MSIIAETERARNAPHATQRDLFFDESRWPKKPWCSDDLGTGVKVRNLKTALTRRYIQANPPWLRVWSIYDVDRPGATLLWESENLPPPSWATTNLKNGHAHLVWGLKAPVLVDGKDMRQKPLRYLCAVEAAFRAKLQADQGYSGLITKNPKHPLWRTLYGPRADYDLAELAEWVDLKKHIPNRKPEEVGLGRNVTLFDALRHYAYRNIRHHKLEVRNFVLWQNHLNLKGLERNGDFLNPMDGREVWHIAKSVSKWVWQRFDLADSDSRFAAKQAHRGRRGGVASGVSRATASEDKRASARLMRAAGMTQQAIANELDVHVNTVANWLAPTPDRNPQ
jgi:hypothetical protein